MKIKYVMAMAAALFLAACSNEIEDMNEQPTPENGTVKTEEEKTEEEKTEEEKTEEESKLQIVEDEVAPFDATQYQGGLNQAEQEVARKILEMDIRLCGSVMGGHQENTVFSPYSLHQVVAMAMNATSDEVLSQLMQQYGLTQADLKLMNDVFRKQRNMLAGRPDGYVTLEVANKLWVDNSIPVYRSYMALLQNYYDAETEAIDCFSPEGSSTVNRWVEEKTHGLIHDIVPPNETGWYVDLMNAIYMKAAWTSEFLDVKKMDFQNLDGSKADADMMHRIEGLRYAETEQGRILRVPLRGRQYEVDFILPADGVEAGSVLANLNSMISQCNKDVMVDVLLPKCKIYNKIEMNEHLVANGLSAIFDADAHPRFSPSHMLNLNRILQHACIDFNEKGIEAAAVTEAKEATVIGDDKPEFEIIPFHMDRPFLFVIRNQQLNTLLFVGKVCQM